MNILKPCLLKTKVMVSRQIMKHISVSKLQRVESFKMNTLYTYTLILNLLCYESRNLFN